MPFLMVIIRLIQVTMSIETFLIQYQNDLANI